MYSYIAVTWNVQATDCAHYAARIQRHLGVLPGFEIALSTPGLFIIERLGLGTSCGACLLPQTEGAIMGTLFAYPTEGEVPKRRRSLSTDEAAEIVLTGGAHLVAQYWGRYVAFVRIPQTSRYRVIRDPSGMLPCFMVADHGVQIWFSDLWDISRIVPAYGAIDWNYIETHVVMRFVSSSTSALIGISEVLAGESYEPLDDTIQRKRLWDPALISAVSVIENSEVAAERLRSLVIACVNAWALEYQSILHTLSGGLDSAIVAAALADVRDRTSVTCLNYYTVEPEGDERRYSRASAEKADLELIESCRDPKSIDLSKLLRVAASPKPWYYRYELEHADYEYSLAELHEARAIFAGGGGDGLFYRSQAAFAVADYLQLHGLTRQLPSIALDAARLDGTSMGSILLNAVTARRVTDRWNPKWALFNPRSFVAADVNNSQRALLISHFDRASAVPPGKALQIENTSIPPSFYDPFGDGRAVERVSPLVSQPIVEHCLKVPTYLLIENGWDRAIARRAFDRDLPRSVVGRRGKGAITGHMRAVFNHNLAFIREFLLSGDLVTRGILNGPHLAACTTEGAAVLDGDISEIFDHLSTESWIRSHAERINLKR